MNIGRGARGSRVLALQQLLQMAGYDGKLDGKFGFKTWKAVKRFQRQLGLTVTGIWDDAMQTAVTGFLQGTNPNPNTQRPGVPWLHQNPNRLPVHADTSDPSKRDALSGLRDVLKRYDLDELLPWAWEQILRGSSMETILLDLYEQDKFQERFSVIEERRKKGLPPLSVQAVLEYEQQSRYMMKMAGFPPQLYNNRSTVHSQLANDVSLEELQARIQKGWERVANADPQIRDYFNEKFGLRGDSALALFFIDPNKALPELERMATAAEIGGAGRRLNFEFGLQTTMDAAARGVDLDEAKQIFGQLDRSRGLFDELASERETDITVEQGFTGLTGGDGGIVKSLERRLAGRVAKGEGSTDFSRTERGFSGFSSGTDS